MKQAVAVDLPEVTCRRGARQWREQPHQFVKEGIRQGLIRCEPRPLPEIPLKKGESNQENCEPSSPVWIQKIQYLLVPSIEIGAMCIHARANEAVEKPWAPRCSPIFALFRGSVYPSENSCVDCGAFYEVAFCECYSKFAFGTFSYRLNARAHRRRASLRAREPPARSAGASEWSTLLGIPWQSGDLAISPIRFRVCNVNLTYATANLVLRQQVLLL